MSCGHYLRQEMFITCGPIGNTAITLPLPKSNHLKYYKIVLKNIMFIGWLIKQIKDIFLQVKS